MNNAGSPSPFVLGAFRRVPIITPAGPSPAASRGVAAVNDIRQRIQTPPSPAEPAPTPEPIQTNFPSPYSFSLQRGRLCVEAVNDTRPQTQTSSASPSSVVSTPEQDDLTLAFGNADTQLRAALVAQEGSASQTPACYKSPLDQSLHKSLSRPASATSQSESEEGLRERMGINSPRAVDIGVVTASIRERSETPPLDGEQMLIAVTSPGTACKPVDMDWTLAGARPASARGQSGAAAREIPRSAAFRATNDSSTMVLPKEKDVVLSGPDQNALVKIYRAFYAATIMGILDEPNCVIREHPLFEQASRLESQVLHSRSQAQILFERMLGGGIAYTESVSGGTSRTSSVAPSPIDRTFSGNVGPSFDALSPREPVSGATLRTPISSEGGTFPRSAMVRGSVHPRRERPQAVSLIEPSEALFSSSRSSATSPNPQSDLTPTEMASVPVTVPLTIVSSGVAAFSAPVGLEGIRQLRRERQDESKIDIPRMADIQAVMSSGVLTIVAPGHPDANHDKGWVDTTCLGVCDGATVASKGQKNGSYGAQLASQALQTKMADLVKAIKEMEINPSEEVGRTDIAYLLSDSLYEVEANLKSNNTGETTVSAAIVVSGENGELYLFALNCGDSDIVVYNPKSKVATSLNPNMDADEARAHPGYIKDTTSKGMVLLTAETVATARQTVVRCVSHSPQMIPAYNGSIVPCVSFMKVEADDIVLAVSDGVTDNFPEGLSSLMSSMPTSFTAEQVGPWLFAHTLLNDKKFDDVTISCASVSALRGNTAPTRRSSVEEL